MKRLLLLFWLLPFTALGQYRISGKVINLADKKPVANASVLLSNASAGAKTNEDGTYTITNVRGGQYELIVSIVGYASYRQTIMVNKDLILPDIEIIPQTIDPSKGKTPPDINWAQHYDMFKEEFLGHSLNAKQCKILNPKVIHFNYDDLTGVLTASSSDCIEVENKALGYKIRYQLTYFTKNYSNEMMYYGGYAFFEDLPGSKSQISRCQKNRLNTYDGSSMQFLRSVIANRLKDDGFKVLRLIRKPNPDYKGGPFNMYIETPVSTPLELSDFVQSTAIKGQYALSFKDCLYIMHEIKPALKEDTEPIPQYLHTTITLAEPDAYFDNNGIIINPESTMLEGEWTKSRVSDLLPVDYEPLK